MELLLTPEEIGDNLDLEVEATYPCSDRSKVMTVSVDKLLEAQLAKVRENGLDREKVAKITCEALNCDIAVKANCRVNFNVICEGCYKIADQILALLEAD